MKFRKLLIGLSVIVIAGGAYSTVALAGKLSDNEAERPKVIIDLGTNQNTEHAAEMAKSKNLTDKMNAGFANYESKPSNCMEVLYAGASYVLDKQRIVEDEVLPEGMARSELTNELVPEEVAEQRPVAVMINNYEGAMPQASIEFADIVYESYTEASITRLLALVQDYDDITKIGPIRSCRDYYVEWALEWDPILVHFGGPELYVGKYYELDELDNLNGVYLDGSVFFRDSSRLPANNAYVSGETIKQGIERFNYTSEHTEYYQGLHFKFASTGTESLLPNQGIEATTVKPGYITNKPWFEYCDDDKLYYRFQYGVPHIDQLSGEQVAYRNIIIQFAEEEKRDQKGYLQIEVVDEGKGGYFITDGRAIEITWEKDSETGQTRYYDKNGMEIRLNTGKTWICIVPENEKDKVEIE